MTDKPTQVSYWLVGLSNKSQLPAVVCDLLGANAAVIRSDSHTLTRRDTLRADARTWANKIAKHHGIAPAAVFYDDDSTQAFSDC